MRFYEQDIRDVPSYTKLYQSMVTARKSHVCCYCRQPIPKGSRYWRHVGLDDGQFFRNASHTLNGGCIPDGD